MTTRTQARSAHLAALVFLAAVGLAGCGASAPAEPVLPQTPEGSLAALDRAENDLLAAIGGRTPPAGTAGPSVGSPAQPGYAQPAPPPPPSPAPDGERKPAATGVTESPANASREADAPAGLAASDPCSTACRALASMRRAADRLCQLSGDGDARCDSARQRVESAGDRVRWFCPACSSAPE